MKEAHRDDGPLRSVGFALVVLDDEGVGEAEVNDGFGGDVDVAITRCSGEQRASTCASGTADREADSAGGEAANQHACARHAANESGSAATFAALGADAVVGIEIVLISIKGHGGEAYFEEGCALEVTAAMGCVDASIHGGAARDDNAAIRLDGLDYFTIEAIACVTGLDVDPLIDADGKFSACGNTHRYMSGLLVRLGGSAGSRLSIGVAGCGLTRPISWLSAHGGRVERCDDGVGLVGPGAGRRRRDEGRHGCLLACCGRRLDGIGYGIAVLIDVLNLLGSVRARGLRFGLVECFLLLAFATCEQGESDETCCERNCAMVLLNCHGSPSTLLCGLRRTANAEIFHGMRCRYGSGWCLKRQKGLRSNYDEQPDKSSCTTIVQAYTTSPPDSAVR
jgi:hypothetical protein